MADAYLGTLPELVREAKLPATFHYDGTRLCTMHSSTGTYRGNSNQQAWVEKEILGSGGQGSVELQISEQLGERKFRAVKCILVSERQRKVISELIVRELEAIFKFSQARYSTLFVKAQGWYTSSTHIYLAMDHYKLGDLSRYLKDPSRCPNGRLPEDEARDIAAQVLDAISRMHEENFAHRDIKPANILIESSPPNRWWVKVGDFGLSKQSTETTDSSTARGTPSFSPPELLGYHGNIRTASPYSVDIWCIGDTVFRVISGQATFDTQALVGSYYEGRTDFPKVALEKLQVSSQAIAFLNSLMAPKPENRLTAKDALKHRWIEMEAPGGIPNPPDPFKSSGLSDLEPKLSLPTDIWASDATASWTQTSFHSQAPQETLQRTTQEVTKTGREVPPLENSTRVSNLRSMKDVPPIWTNTARDEAKLHSRPLATREKIIPSYLRYIARMTVGVEERATRIRTGHTHSERQTEDKESCGDGGTPATQTQAVPRLPEMEQEDGESFASWNSAAWKNGSSDHRLSKEKSVQNFGDAQSTKASTHPKRDRQVEAQTAAISSDNTTTSAHDGMGKRADILFEEGDFEQAELIYRDIITQREMTFGKSDRGALESMQSLADTLYAQNKLESAKEVYQETLDARRAVLGADNNETLRTMQNLATTLYELGLYGDAEKMYRETVHHRKLILGVGHLHTMNSMHDLADSLYKQGQFHEASEIYREVLSSRKFVLGNCHTKTISSMDSLASALVGQREFAEAASLYHEIISIKSMVLGPEHGDIIRNKEDLQKALENLAAGYKSTGSNQRVVRYNEPSAQGNRSPAGDQQRNKETKFDMIAKMRSGFKNMTGRIL